MPMRLDIFHVLTLGVSRSVKYMLKTSAYLFSFFVELSFYKRLAKYQAERKRLKIWVTYQY